MPAKRQAQYTGKLATPLPKLSGAPLSFLLRGLVPPGTAEAERAERLNLLFAHYHIEPHHSHCWAMLALRLAAEHVPGFREAQSGRPPSRKSEERRRARRKLLEEVTQLKQKNPALSNSAASERLAKRWARPSESGPYAGKTTSFFRKELVEARREAEECDPLVNVAIGDASRSYPWSSGLEILSGKHSDD